MDIRPRHQETRVMDGEKATAFFYQYGDRVIWGATARILNQFLDIFAETADAVG